MRVTGKKRARPGWRGNSPALLSLALLCVLALAGVAAAQIVNIVTATGEYAGAPVTATATESVTVAGPVTNSNGLTIEMSTTASVISRGQAVPYLITVSNPGPGPRTGVEVVNLMPAGFSYIEGSGEVNGLAMEPASQGRQLTFSGLSLTVGSTAILRISLVAGPSVTAPEFVASSYARDTLSGDVVSNTAKAVVTLRTEPVFDCSDIAGRVYEDRNRDGYYQAGEPGIGGVRLATVTGLLITTDARGRYSIACPYIPDDASGSNFIVKLDESSLPAGYSATSENPSTIRLTRGKLTRLDFGVSAPRLVELDLDERSFVPGSVTPTAATLQGLAVLVEGLSSEQSRLQITYRGTSTDLSTKRLDLIKSILAEVWSSRNTDYVLPIETIFKNE